MGGGKHFIWLIDVLIIIPIMIDTKLEEDPIKTEWALGFWYFALKAALKSALE